MTGDSDKVVRTVEESSAAVTANGDAHGQNGDVVAAEEKQVNPENAEESEDKKAEAVAEKADEACSEKADEGAESCEKKKKMTIKGMLKKKLSMRSLTK